LVALKELNRDRFSTHKFLRELRFLLSLQHENIVTCHAMEQTATGRYLVMDYCEGGTLRNLLEEDIKLNPLLGLDLITQILAGLAQAHEHEIVHCDIKPENILLTVNAAGWTAKISDFGIARLSQEMDVEDFSNTGSPAYMAPERFYGQYSIASDLYAVGVLLFELLVGRRPFSGVPTELMSAHLNRAVQIPEAIPPDLQAVIRTALQKLPARRFRSALAMRTALQIAIAAATEPLSQGWRSDELLRSGPTTPAVTFQADYRELLDTPIQHLGHWLPSATSGLAPSSAQNHSFYRVYGNRIGIQPYAELPAELRIVPALQLNEPPAYMQRVRLPEAIAQLIVQDQGCFAVTHQAVYWLDRALFQPTVDPVLESAQAFKSPQLIMEFERRSQVAISPSGHWMATTHPTADALISQLKLWKLPLSQPPKNFATRQIPTPFQLLIPDSRHLGVASHLTDASSQSSITGVQIDLISRRGTEGGCFQLPIPLRQLVPTPIPYRFLATEPQVPQACLFLDIKPLRIQRIGLDLTPHLFAATTWGFAVISQDGQIVLMDAYGQVMGQIAGPPQPTAFTFLSPQQLLIATWEETQGYLYGVNLQALELDILF
jgi:serine/threonine-protein kinase